MPPNNVVITGLGVVSSIGIGAEVFFQSLLEKRSGIQSLSARTDDGAKPGVVDQPAGLWIGGPIVDFDPKQHVRPRKSLKVMCREIQTAFAASQLAIEGAGLSDVLPADPDGSIQPRDVGTVFGSEMFYGPPEEMLDVVDDCKHADGTIDVSQFATAARKHIMPLWMLKYLPNMPACHIGIAINAHGPNNTLVLGDVSGPAALMESASCIKRGIAKAMITGATGTRINTTRLNYRADLPLPDPIEPVDQSSRPYNPSSSGVVGGEGAAAMVIEDREFATKNNRNPIASLVSSASRFCPSDGFRTNARSASRGSATAIRLAVESALRIGKLTAEDIGLVVSHAMGDPLMDKAERDALAEVLPGRPLVAPIASLGHTGAASGMIGLATAALAIQRETIPPTLGANAVPDEVGLLDDPGPLASDYVLSLSHTSEGSATAVILGRP